MLKTFDEGVTPALNLVMKLLKKVDPELHDIVI